jgi:hypothetical protein
MRPLPLWRARCHYGVQRLSQAEATRFCDTIWCSMFFCPAGKPRFFLLYEHAAPASAWVGGGRSCSVLCWSPLSSSARCSRLAQINLKKIRVDIAPAHSWPLRLLGNTRGLACVRSQLNKAVRNHETAFIPKGVTSGAVLRRRDAFDGLATLLDRSAALNCGSARVKRLAARPAARAPAAL